MLDLKQLLKTPRVDPLFDISPDGKKLAFSWNKSGEWQIYEAELENPLQVKSLTMGIGGKFNPRYSPDGMRLAYVLDVDGSESYHLIVYDQITNRHTDLTPNISFALQPNFSWSPDGTQLALLSNEQGQFNAHVISTDGGDKRLILNSSHPAWQVEWSPTGSQLAVSCEMHGQDYSIFVVDLITEKVVELPLNAQEPKWSPDGNKLAFQSDEHGWFDIGVYDLSTKKIEWVTQCEGDSLTPNFKGTNIAYKQSKGASNRIEICDVNGNRNNYQIGKGIHDGIRFTSDLKWMVCTFSSPSQPPDLWMIDLESGDSTQLTKSLPHELSNTEFVIPQEIEYDGMDGVSVPALLFRAQQTPGPAVVMIHGGPNWHYSSEWNPLMAYFANRGYVVLCPNYRGSTGYGRDWQYAAQFDMGGVDMRDVASGAQYLLRKGLAKRIAVTGRSHGGYLTMACLTQFPDLWCAGSAVVPFTNWFKSHDNSREDLQHWNIENMGDPKENYELWYNASPYFFLDKILAPVQMICGSNDPRCPASDSIETHDKLLELGKDVELLLFEDEGHEFLKIENVLESETKRVEFLARVLGN